MHLFRKLAGNIFFKIILAFVALSFVLFGISGFILGNPNSWVVKVGSTTIGQNSFLKAMQNDREIILASNRSPEALKFVESEQFKSSVLSRLVNKIMIEKLNEDFGVAASRKLILEAVAKDANFKNKEGKFDRNLFKNFLTKNGLNEERYVSEIANEVTATMIIQTLSMGSPLNHSFVLEAENFKQEKRVADVITISAKEVGNLAKPDEEALTKFFEQNKQNYSAPEIRQISYLSFSKENFARDLQISENEIAAQYEKNKDQFLTPEYRNFYHILFDKETAAKDFLQKFNTATKQNKSGSKEEFARLAKELANKDLKAITLSKISKKDLIPELLEPTFKLDPEQSSEVLQSPLGFHIFLLVEVKKPETIPFSQAKENIKKQLLQGREEKILQTKVSEIDDALLTSNSLAEVAKKFGLKISQSAIRIDQVGQNERGELVNEIKGLDDFIKNAFALKKAQTSKVFYSKTSQVFYALKAEEIVAAHEKRFTEVKSQVSEDLLKQLKSQALQNLAEKIGKEIKENPAQAAQIAAKHKAKFEKNREFPRVLYTNFQGRQVAYQNKFLDELFGLKIGQATSILPGKTQESAKEFVIGILREIKKSTASSNQFEQAQQEAVETFKTEVLQEYNSFLLKKNPVKLNEKVLGQKEEN